MLENYDDEMREILEFREKQRKKVNKLLKMQESWKSQAQESSPIDVTKIPRFEPSSPELLVYLREHGYAVVKSVLSPVDVEKAKTLFSDFLRDQIHAERGKPETFTNFSKIGDKFTGIISGGNAGHSDCAWFVRTRPRVKQAFANVWKTKDLISSFDGLNAFLPWHRSKQAEQTDKTAPSWFHVDQGIDKGPGLRCVQGLVSLKDATPGTGGLCVVDGSHTKHEYFLSYAALNKGDFVMCPEFDPIINKGKRLITCLAGDLVLWDSRTLHCNTPALVHPTNSPNQLLRQVAYVCMTPKNLASVGVIRCRCRGALQNIGTNHWPHEWHPIRKANFKLGRNYTPEQCQAIKYFHKAIALEEQKQFKEAMHFYDDAFRLYPELEKNSELILGEETDPLTQNEKKILLAMPEAKQHLIGFEKSM